MKLWKRILSLLAAAAMVCTTAGTLAFAAEGPNLTVGNLLENPGFEDDQTGWSFSPGSGIQTNNKRSGVKGFFVDYGATKSISQLVEVPFSGFYKNTAYIATGGTGSKYGIRRQGGAVLQELTLPSGASYTAAHQLPPVELKQGDKVEVFCSGGNSWTNGDDFTLQYDLSRVNYNLLTGQTLSSQPTSIRLPRGGDYLFTASVTGATVTVGDQTKTVPSGETQQVSLSVTAQAPFALLPISVEGGSISNASLTLDVSKIPNEPPVATQVQAAGIALTDTSLSGSYSFSDPDVGQSEGTTLLGWLSAETVDGTYTPIEGATTALLTLTDALENRFIKFQVTPVDSYGLAGTPVLSEAVGPVAINWVRNTSFEIENSRYAPVGWSTKSGGKMPNSPKKARTGFRYGEIAQNSPGGEVFYTLETSRTANYTAGVWVKTAEAGGEFGVRLAGQSAAIKSMPLPAASAYTYVELDDIAIEKGTSVEVFIKGSAGNKAISADDFVLLYRDAENLPEFANLFSFAVDGQVGDAIIRKDTGLITFKVPYGTDVTALNVHAVVSEGATVSHDFSQPVDFTSPVRFTVSNGSTSHSWTAKCTVNSQKIALESDNQTLEENFNWAVEKTDQFIMTGKAGPINVWEGDLKGQGPVEYIPSYWAGYYDRTAFYGRDFVHQAVGAQIVGQWEENYSMFNVFAKGANEARKWYTLWAFNFDGSNYTLDYKGDTNFVREVPAQFELVEKAYKQYLWSGDTRYITDPTLWNFYTKVMTDYVTLHDTINGNGVAEGTTGGIFKGSCTYNERGGEHPIEAGDSIGSQYQATLAYAAMLAARGETAASEQWYQKAADLKKYFNEEWSVYNNDPQGQYARGVATDGTKYAGFGKENSWFMPLKMITEPGPRNDAYLTFISEKLANGIGTGPEVPNNLEAYTYIPDMYFLYNWNDEAWKWMQYIVGIKDEPHERPSQGTNGDYPEISYTFISHVIEGMMGVEPDAAAHFVATVPRLPSDVGYAKANYITAGQHHLDVEHTGLVETSLTNNAPMAITWEARFYGDYPAIVVDGKTLVAKQKLLNGKTISYVQVEVAANGTANASVDAEAVVSDITVNAVVGGNALVTADAEKAASGETVTLTIAEIENGKRVKSVSATDADNAVVPVSTVAEGVQYSFTMPTKAVTVTVELEEIVVLPDEYLLTVGGGTGTGSYAAGAEVTAVAIAPEGQRFTSWIAMGLTLTEEQRTARTLSFVMPANSVTLTAQFAEEEPAEPLPEEKVPEKTPGEPSPSNTVNAPETANTVRETVKLLETLGGLDALAQLPAQERVDKLPRGVKLAQTASGNTLATVEVKMTGSSLVNFDTMKLLGQAGPQVGLKATIGFWNPVELILPGGFTPAPHVYSLPMSYRDTAPSLATVEKLPALAGKQLDSFMLGVGELPTEATITFKTKLAEGSRLAVNRYDAATGKLTKLADAMVEDGKVTFATAILGEFVLVAE